MLPTIHGHIIKICQDWEGEPTPPEVVARFVELHWQDCYPQGGEGGDENATRYLIILGLQQIVRQLMHRGIVKGTASPEAEVQQLTLDLWSQDEQEIAIQIGIDAAYVPSRGTYVVLYDKQQISTAELDEAVKHLMAHANDIQRRAEWIARLRAKRLREAVAQTKVSEEEPVE